MAERTGKMGAQETPLHKLILSGYFVTVTMGRSDPAAWGRSEYTVQVSVSRPSSVDSIKLTRKLSAGEMVEARFNAIDFTLEAMYAALWNEVERRMATEAMRWYCWVPGTPTDRTIDIVSD